MHGLIYNALLIEGGNLAQRVRGSGQEPVLSENCPAGHFVQAEEPAVAGVKRAVNDYN